MLRKSLFLLAIACLGAVPLKAQIESPKLSVQRDDSIGGIQLHLENADVLYRQGAWLQLQRSVDLVHWEDLLVAPSSTFVPEDSSLVYEEAAVGIHFFRLLINQRVAATAASGDVLFGFAQSFAHELENAGQLSVEAYLERYSDDANRLNAIDFNPEESEFWDQFNAKPNKYMPPGKYDDKELRLLDFRLNDEELALFKKNGMVVSARLGAPSYVDAYYGIFTEDLPVFVTADSIMHAWHKTYAEMLMEMEEKYLAPSLSEFLDTLHDGLPALAETLEQDVLGDSLNDVDFYLTVARSLYTGTKQRDRLGQSRAKSHKTINDIQNSYIGTYDLFGRTGDNAFVDFSQMKVRGHYTSSPILSKYFQAAMWCGRIDFRVAGPKKFSSPRELGSAIILNELVKQTETLKQWQDFDEVLKVYVGVSDSMGFDQLGLLLESAGIQHPNQIQSLDALNELQTTIESGDFGFQQIRSHPFAAKLGGSSLVLPRSFTVFGQKFVVDSWALSQLVFDQIFWDDKKVVRRLPSALDIAFTVFGNRNAADLLAERIQREDGVPFRDGYPVQHHLAALHEVFLLVPDSSWQNNIYTGWLKALRELSDLGSPNETYVPQAFRTKAWKNRVMTAQLGSWTELRHDTVLYVKQSATPPLLCSFPYSYVEPKIGFWEAMEDLCKRSGSSLSQIDVGESKMVRPPFGPPRESNEKLAMINQHITHFYRFGTTMQTLKSIAERQQSQKSLTDQQIDFLQNMVEIMGDYTGQQRNYNGWYPKLFYPVIEGPWDGRLETGHPSDIWDPLVTDVHTNYPDHLHGDPGTILMEGVGNVAMMLVAVDCEDGESRVYAGCRSLLYTL